MNKYDHKKIEAKWQAYWLKHKTFFAKDFSKKPKKYILTEFPYPSGEGLHMGHLRPYVAGDVYTRFSRLKGQEVIFPMGWDAFGLPAENYAIKTGVNPAITTKRNVANAKRQMLSWGLSFDWSREVNTTDPNYYKWTQWLFLRFYKAGLAYEATGMINWCPKDKTGLANEEVIDGKCERCGTTVEKKELRQWYLKITVYAEKLLEGLKNLPEWPEAVKLQRENWIGKSVGAEIDFPIKNKFNYVLLHGFKGNSGGVFFPWLKKGLERNNLKYQAPDLPNPANPTEQEQVNFVLNNCRFDENTVLFGHSLGAVVAMKVLEKLDHKIAGLVLAGGFVEPKFKDKKRPYNNKFVWVFNFKKIKNMAGFVKILSDPADFAVPLEQGKILAEKFGCQLIEQNGQKPHFTAAEEPIIFTSLVPSLKIFTTRPDTIFGATYMVVAPEHPIIQNFEPSIENFGEVSKYIERSKKKSEIDRSAEGKEKTGMKLKGVKAINPATNQEIPVWVADYVLWGYGTGAIMAVPAHDERDNQFAKKFDLPIVPVVSPFMGSINTADESANYSGPGTLINSGEFTAMKSQDAIPKMAAAFGKLTTQYKLRDWVFSRQRYWGEPIPIIHCKTCGQVDVPEKDLPVKLPPVRKYEPTGTGDSPLASIAKWVNTKCPNCGGKAKRETNTMPQWAGSSWYWLRYVDPQNKKEFSSFKKQKYWTPVDIYFGGMEHTTLHLLYSRFWNLFLYDQKLVTVKEPYVMRRPHGIVLAADGEKMSKSRGNVVNPDDIVKSHGADTLRMYELFLGPHESSVSWNDQGVVGVKRFLDRAWQWVNELAEAPHRKDSSVKDSKKVEKALNRLIMKVTEDLQNFRFNTCVSAFMEFHNEIKDEFITLKSVQAFLVVLYPFAPHLSEELNQILGFKKSLQLESWPGYDPAKTLDQTIEIVVQINGRVKAKLNVARDSGQEAVKGKVLELDAVKQALVDESIKRLIFVPNKLINLVI